MNLAARPSVDRIVAIAAWICIAAGIVFRFVHLDAPLFWQDEQYTSLYATGHYDRDVAKLFDGRVHTVAEVARYGTIDAGSQPANVVTALREEDPQHPPAFYLLEHATVRAIGSSIADFRVLPACLGTLAIGLAYLLARRVFRSPLAGTVAAALFALCPIFVLYSRQAREYSLFVDDVLLSSLALLAALDAAGSQRFRGWAVYAATLALGLYTHPLFTIVIAAHAVTTLLEPGKRLSRLPFLAAAVAIAEICYFPWVSRSVKENLDWGAVPYPLAYVVEKSAFNLGSLVFDGEFRYAHLTALGAAFAAGVIVAFAVFARTGGPARPFVLPLALSAIVAVGARDLVLGSHVSTIARYLTPSLVGLELALTGALVRGLTAGPARVRAIAAACFACVAAGGIGAAVARGSQPNWWDNNDQIPFQAVARRASETPHPLLYTSTYLWIPRELALYVRPDARFVMFTDAIPLPPLPREPFYLVTPTSKTLARYEALAKGRDRIDNVSPVVDSLITGFHRDIGRDQKSIASRTFLSDLRAGESLFLFTPVAGRDDAK